MARAARDWRAGSCQRQDGSQRSNTRGAHTIPLANCCAPDADVIEITQFFDRPAGRLTAAK
jgi:hypothetical protein